MAKAFAIFIPTAIVVLLLNQSMYGNCYKPHCLAAAFPRVVIMSAVLTAVIYFITKSEQGDNEGKS